MARPEDGTHVRWDDAHFGDAEQRVSVIPARAVVPLLLGAGIYFVYRMLQVVVLNRAENVMAVSDRVLVVIGDGLLMALLAPVAIAATRYFPIVNPHRARNLAAHLVVATATAYLWIVALLGVSSVVTHTPFRSPAQLVSLPWLTSNAMAYWLMVAVLHALQFHYGMRAREVQSARLEM